EPLLTHHTRTINKMMGFATLYPSYALYPVEYVTFGPTQQNVAFQPSDVLRQDRPWPVRKTLLQQTIRQRKGVCVRARSFVGDDVVVAPSAAGDRPGKVGRSFRRLRRERDALIILQRMRAFVDDGAAQVRFLQATQRDDTKIGPAPERQRRREKQVMHLSRRRLHHVSLLRRG